MNHFLQTRHHDVRRARLTPKKYDGATPMPPNPAREAAYRASAERIRSEMAAMGMSIGERPILACKFCGDSFEQQRPGHVFCSHKCRNAYGNRKRKQAARKHAKGG